MYLEGLLVFCVRVDLAVALLILVPTLHLLLLQRHRTPDLQICAPQERENRVHTEKYQ